MQVKYLWFFVPMLLAAQEEFMSHYEYGQMLYNNPRGVSCAKCHGKKGEGRVIVSYRDKSGKQSIAGPDIRNENLQSMLAAVSKSHHIMPRYYLTDEEVEAIHDYLHQKNSTE